MSTLLEVKGLSRTFGGIRAVNNVSFAVTRGVLTGVIGPNGAGKTTLFNLITGFTRPSAGEIILNGKAITDGGAAQIARLGVVRTFQAAQVFAGHTVFENLYRAALFRQFPQPWLLFNPAALKKGREIARYESERVLELTELTDVGDVEASSLAYGLQKILGVGMALTATPKVLLMDEPAAGLNPVETVSMADLIARIHATGIDIVLVEHDMGLVMSLCKQLIVLANGHLLANGATEHVKQDPKVLEAYLGADLENA